MRVRVRACESSMTLSAVVPVLVCVRVREGREWTDSEGILWRQAVRGGVPSREDVEVLEVGCFCVCVCVSVSASVSVL